MIFKTQNSIPDLETIAKNRYENLFKVYTVQTNKKNYYYYNITNKIQIPEQTNSQVFDTKVFDKKTPWTIAAYQLYGSINLWYILSILNPNLQNRFFISAGEEIRYIKPNYINLVINSINE